MPEIASRKHIEKINQVIQEALEESDKTMEDIDAVCVTYGPGLVGALLVGVGAAKALAYATHKPLVGVHHIEGHISANFIENKDLEPAVGPLPDLSIFPCGASESGLLKEQRDQAGDERGDAGKGTGRKPWQRAA